MYARRKRVELENCTCKVDGTREENANTSLLLPVAGSLLCESCDGSLKVAEVVTWLPSRRPCASERGASPPAFPPPVRSLTERLQTLLSRDIRTRPPRNGGNQDSPMTLTLHIGYCSKLLDKNTYTNPSRSPLSSLAPHASSSYVFPHFFLFQFSSSILLVG